LRDSLACVANTVGLLRRASIIAADLVPIGKETDRHWEQGEDSSLVDFKVKEFRKKRMEVAEISDREKWRLAGVRHGARKSGLSPNTVQDILNGVPVKVETLATFSRAMKGQYELCRVAGRHCWRPSQRTLVASRHL
jgi:hypothetical protein